MGTSLDIWCDWRYTSDMTATCAVPPGNPTSQVIGGWPTLQHVGNSGLVQSVNVHVQLYEKLCNEKGNNRT